MEKAMMLDLNKKVNVNDFGVFVHDTLGELNAVIDKSNGNIYFSALSVGTALGYKNIEKTTASLPEKYKKKVFLKRSSGKKGGANFIILISEAGLYKLAFTSRAKNAELFQDWVCNQVLPSIRKNGGYILGQELLSAEQQEILTEKVRSLSTQVKAVTDKMEWEKRRRLILSKEKNKLKSKNALLISENGKLESNKAYLTEMINEVEDEYARIVQELAENYDKLQELKKAANPIPVRFVAKNPEPVIETAMTGTDNVPYIMKGTYDTRDGLLNSSVDPSHYFPNM